MKDDHRKVFYLLIAFFLLAYAVILLRNAWICDDAYISIRTVDNFVHGYGLTWNVVERVQVYTHPLWLFLITPFYAVTGEVYFTVLIISVLISLGAVAWYAFKIAHTWATAILGVMILTMSAAFIDFSTSGLENPLTFLLLAIFLYYYFKGEFDHKALLRLSLIASLGAVNRLDAIVLFAPMLVHVFWKVRGLKAIRILIIGFLPLIAWELFSLLYYGFPFPNTAYAKLDTGIDKTTVWLQGLWYILYSIKVDAITVIVILSAAVIGFIGRTRTSVAPAIAIILYLLYIINIGGCFMSGRYLAAPLLVAIALLAQYRNTPTTLLRLWTIVIILVGLSAPDSPIFAKASDKGEREKIWHGIVRERDWYNPTHGLINYDPSAVQWPKHDWIELGQKNRAEGVRYMPHVAVGMVGFYSGPQTFILDVYAITDPLLARLPVDKHINTRVGHFGRFVPVGYAKTVISGQNNIRDPYLAQYYDKLSLLTRGDIFSLSRLGEIFKFNLGWYDHLIRDYTSPHLMKANLEDISEPRIKGIIGFYAQNIVYLPEGLEVDLGRVYHAPKFEIGRDNYTGQRFDFFLAGQKVASGMIPSRPGRPREVIASVISVPDAAVEQGYDSIIIYPDGPPGGFYSISHLRLIE